MKIGINSKTIRVILDNGEIYDFKFEDGSTSRHLLSIISARVSMDYFKKYIKTDNFKKINDISIPLTWGIKDIDKFENINYIDVDSSVGTVDYGYDEIEYDDDDDLDEEIYIKPKPLIPPIQETINLQNEKNFKKLFGK